jgi:hypothetical protein
VPVTLPDGSTLDPSGVCGQPIGSVASQIVGFEHQYQAATLAAGPAVNSVYIGNVLADGIDATGTNLFFPGYKTPRSVQMNFGMQHQFGNGPVLSIDYLRNISTHTLLSVDTNHQGDARYLDTNAALGAINATVTPVGCPAATSAGASSQAAVACYLGTVSGADISQFAANGLDSAASLCFGLPCGLAGAPAAAFPGVNAALGTNQMLFPIGRSVYNGLQMSLRENVRNPFTGVSSLNLQVSYALSKYVSTARDNDFINFAQDNANPLKYIGPNGLDRRHQFSFGGTADLPHAFRLSLIGHFYSPLPANLTLSPTGAPGGIFVTDVTGDGTGDGSVVSNGGLGDLLPGTNVGSFGRSVTGSNINNAIRAYNNMLAGTPTPAGTALINAGLVTSSQLVALHGVQQPVALAPFDQANLGWLRVLDLKLGWAYRVKDRVSIEPGVSFFNVMNFANFDGPNNPLSGILNGTAGSANGTSGQQPNSNRLGLGSGVFGLGSPRVIEFALKLTF